jgi:hypothetical protein
LGRHSRHEELNNVLSRALQSAGFPNRREPTGLSVDAALRPDGMTLLPWDRGKLLVWDATVSCTLASSYVARTSLQAGAAAALAYNRKLQKYAALSPTYVVQPVAFETLGTIDPSTSVFLTELGKRLRLLTHHPQAAAFLYQRLSVALQRGNSTSILGSSPDGVAMLLP